MSGIVQEVLTEAYKTIEDPLHWCKGFYALGTDPRLKGVLTSVSEVSPYAERWCAIGAMRKAVFSRYNNDTGNDSMHFVNLCYSCLQAACDEVQPRERNVLESITSVNDATDHEMVLTIYKRALEIAPTYTFDNEKEW